MTKISVIMAAFNAAPTLVESLDSIAAQTRRADEIIVVDDGSQDNTAELARAHRLAPLVLQQDNGGAASALNRALARASGTVIAVLDSDDLWTPRWLEAAEQALRASQCDMAFGTMRTFRDSALAEDDAALPRYVESADVARIPGACLMRRAVFDKIGDFDASLRTGYFIQLYDRARSAGATECAVGGEGLLRRIHANSLSWRTRRDRGGEPSRIASDFLKIARDAIHRRRSGAPEDT